MLRALFVLLVVGSCCAVDIRVASRFKVVHHWSNMFEAEIDIPVPHDTQGGWTIILRFTVPVIKIEIWDAVFVRSRLGGKRIIVKNKDNNENLAGGSHLKMKFQGQIEQIGGVVPTGKAILLAAGAPTTSTPIHSTTTSTRPTGSPITTTTEAVSSSSTATTATTTTTTTTTPTTTTTTVTTAQPPLCGTGSGITSNILVSKSWSGTLEAWVEVTVPSPIIGGWTVTMCFSSPVNSIEVWKAQYVSTSSDGLQSVVQNKPWNPNLQAGDILSFKFHGHIAGTHIPVINGTATLRGSGSTGSFSTTSTNNPTTTTIPATSSINPSPSTSGSTLSTSIPSSTTTSLQTTSTPTPTSSSGKYNYSEVLQKSILFYEAQRSGKLPADNRIVWRGDSALTDGADVGLDLSGGWYDAGDHVKFNLPMAWSVTTLAWGILQYGQAYQAVGELSNALDSIKWPLDYFIKCHTKPNELWGQVGNGHTDHSYWGRPEDMTMSRPSFKIDSSNPGSDLAAETAAAMAAGAMVFETYGDASYSAELLLHAKQLYSFAETYKGKYSDSISNAASFYNSWSGYEDELMWGAMWLHLATGEQQYLTKAQQLFDKGLDNAATLSFSWDDKKAGAYVLLHAALPNNNKYRTALKNYVDLWLHQVARTPKGLAWASQWGSNRYTANAAFIALLSADLGILTNEGRIFAQSQIDYMLGDAGRSFVVGFGNNPPQRPHHRGASCTRLKCLSTSDSAPNPNVLEGALVGGPGKNDDYEDKRSDYIKNEVACDYNAGFQSAVAGLLFLQQTTHQS